MPMKASKVQFFFKDFIAFINTVLINALKKIVLIKNAKFPNSKATFIIQELKVQGSNVFHISQFFIKKEFQNLNLSIFHFFSSSRLT